MKRIMFFMMTVFWISTGFVQAGEIERIQGKGEIVVSLNKGYPPFCMTVNDELTGLDVDLAQMIAEHLGVKAKFILPELYKEQIPKPLANKIRQEEHTLANPFLTG